MMKALVLGLIAIGSIASVPTSAQASNMPATYDMTCEQAANLVRNQGAVVMRTGQHTFNRFVSHGGYCVHGEVTNPAWVPTRDSNSCFVGYTCDPDSRGD